MHIEPSAAGRARALAFTGLGLPPSQRKLPARREESSNDSNRARAQIETIAEALDRLESFAAAEVELIEAANQVDEAGLVGYELGVYLDQLSNETRLDPGEMFGCLYVLLNVLEDSGLYDVELTLDDQTTTVDEVLDELVVIAEEAGYYVGPDVDTGEWHLPRVEPVEKKTKERFSKAERFFLLEAKLGWPCGALQLKRQWKILAARFHPDRNPSDREAGTKFRLIKEGYDKLARKLDDC
jgi:hypothetical protein